MLVWKSSCPPHSNANQKVNSTSGGTKGHQNSTKNPLTIASLVFWLYTPGFNNGASRSWSKSHHLNLRDQNRGPGRDRTCCWCQRGRSLLHFSSSVVANSRSAFPRLYFAVARTIMLPSTKARSLFASLSHNWVCTFSFMTMHISHVLRASVSVCIFIDDYASGCVLLRIPVHYWIFASSL